MYPPSAFFRMVLMAYAFWRRFLPRRTILGATAASGLVVLVLIIRDSLL